VPRPRYNNYVQKTNYTSCTNTHTCKYNKKDGYRQRNKRTSVSAISLRHNLAPSRESRRYIVAINTRFAGGGIWLRQESLRHILTSPGYAPGTIAVNVTWMERGFNACQTHRNMYSSIFNPFPVILSVRHFNTFFLHILASHGYASGTIAVNVTRIERGSNALQHVLIYLQPFPRYSEILVENFFIPALHLTPPYGIGP